MLDGQTPDIEVIADGNNDIDDKRAVNTDREAQAQEHKRDVVFPTVRAQSARPADTDVLSQLRTGGVEDGVQKRQDEDVVHRKRGLGQVRGDHLADGVGVDKADVEDKGHEVCVQDCRVEAQIRDDKRPGPEERDEAEQGRKRVLATSASGAEDVQRAGDGVEDEDQAAVEHVPFVPGEVVESVREEGGLGETEGREHRLLPEGGSAFYSGEGVDDAQG